MSKLRWTNCKHRLPKEEGTYLTLDLDTDDIERFEAGEYIPNSDEIGADWFDGEQFIYMINGCEYPAKSLTHWMPVPLSVNYTRAKKIVIKET